MTLRLRQPGSLTDLLNYRLARLFALGGAPVIRLLEGRYGIARREWRLLATLAVHGALSPSALAEQMQLDRPRTSRALASVLAKGLVARVATPGDARRATIRLTEAGQRLHDRVFPEVAAINARLVEALDDAAVRALDDALTRLTEQAEQLNQTVVQDVRSDRHAGGRRGRTPLG
ncbi:MAG: MarR family transcriptional regulator [Burkholderiaceae bacterium]|nr:MarR family transcriptional regulator [Burkholderiaceae bacterium]